jgi:ATP-binding cassette, subfamily B, multidrug efflux pump
MLKFISVKLKMHNLLQLFPYLRRSGRLFALALCCGVLAQVASLLVPRAIEQVARQALARHINQIAPWAILILVLYVVRGGLQALETLIGVRVGQQVLRDLRQDIFSHVERLRLRFFDQTRSGELLSRVTADLDPLEGFFSWGVRMIFRNTLLFLGVLIFCLSMNASLTLISLGFVIPMTATAFIIGNRLRPAWQSAREQVGAFSSALEETLSGIRVVKMYGQEASETAKLTRTSEAVRDQSWRANRLDAAYYPLTGLWAGIASLVVLAYGGSQVIAGRLSLPQYISFEIYIMMLLVPMRMLGWMVSGAQRAAVGAGRILGLMDEEGELLGIKNLELKIKKENQLQTPTDQIPESTLPAFTLNASPERSRRAERSTLVLSEVEGLNEPIKGDITFNRVTFGYRENEPVLRDLSLEIKAGEVIGILGPTGGGKSALVSLIPRFYDPLAGRVLLDGRDLRDYDLSWLRSQIGVVFQEPFLFSGTIRENIAFGKPDASDAEVAEAARRAAIEDFINGLDKGYDTLIGERGLNLSGGQQQRMTIARTLLVDPRILILDDCTSSVDADTEFHIQEALAEVMLGRTSFVIAQRAGSVAMAHRIIVIADGVIVEQGTPAELAQLEGGHYRRLLDVQEALNDVQR